jgi:dTMP kinase
VVTRRAVSHGRFIALEGIDGSGKSTQCRLLAQALRERGRTVTETREPGGTPFGEQMREVLLGTDRGALSDAAEVYLFAAARAQLVAQVVRPALERGEWVVCDRFLDSSLAYQGVGRGVGIDAVDQANALAVAGCLPDVTIIVDMPLAVAMVRRGLGDRIEAEGGSFHERVAEGYRELATRYPDRIRVVPGSGTPRDVHARVIAELATLM